MTSEPSARWSLVPHVCAACFGRLLVRADGDRMIHHCCECGAESEGEHDSLCACGSLPPGSRVRLRCVTNEHRTPDAPNEIVVVEAPPSAARVAPTWSHAEAGRSP
jgi:hypothetical protein